MKDSDDILDYFPEEHKSTFNKDEEIVVAKVFLDNVLARIVSSRLKVEGIKHYLGGGNAQMFAQNVMDGERLFIRKQDFEIVAEIIADIKENHLAAEGKELEEDWYEQVRGRQSYKPYQLASIGIVMVLFIIFLMIVLYQFL